MFKPHAVITATPRLLPAIRVEGRVVLKRIVRISLLTAPALVLLAWWIVHDMDAGAAPVSLLWKLLGAALAIPAMLMVYAVPLWHPRWGRYFLPKWEVWTAGLMVRRNALIAWRDLSNFRVEAGDVAGEVVMRVDGGFRGRFHSVSLCCVRTEVDPALIEAIAKAVENKQWVERM